MTDATAVAGEADSADLGNVSDPHPWRSSVALGVATTAAALMYWFVIAPRFYHGLLEGHGTVWQAPHDAWHLLTASHRITSGDFFGLYEVGFTNRCIADGEPSLASGQYLAGPLLPILLAPIAAIGEHFQLSEAYQFAIPRPSAWPPYATYATLVSAIVFSYAVRSLASELGVRTKQVWVQFSALLVGFVPLVIVFGHFDDALTLSFVLLAWRDLNRKKWMRAAIMLGIAVGFKQWAWLALPLLLVTTPRAHRLRSLIPSVAVPCAYFAMALVTDWCAASHALFGSVVSTRLGHRALWTTANAPTATAGPFRVMLLILAAGIAWKVRKRTDLLGLTSALSVTLLARFAFEPVVFGYYVAPGVVTLLLVDVARTQGIRRWRMVPIAAVLGYLLVGWDSSSLVWWGCTVATVILAVRPSVRLMFRTPGELSLEGSRDDHDTLSEI